MDRLWRSNSSISSRTGCPPDIVNEKAIVSDEHTDSDIVPTKEILNDELPRIKRFVENSKQPYTSHALHALSWLKRALQFGSRNSLYD